MPWRLSLRHPGPTKHKDLLSWVAIQLEPCKGLSPPRCCLRAKPSMPPLTWLCLSPCIPCSLPSFQIITFRVSPVSFSRQRWIPLAEPCLAKQKSGCQLSLIGAPETWKSTDSSWGEGVRTQGLKDSQRFTNRCKWGQGGAGWAVGIGAKKKSVFLFEIVEVEINNDYYVNILLLFLKFILWSLPYIRYNTWCFYMFFMESSWLCEANISLLLQIRLGREVTFSL